MADDDVRVPAGWYPDPLGLPQLRWWDNHAWTEHTSDARQPIVDDAQTAAAGQPNLQQQAAQPTTQQVRVETVIPTRLAYADDLPFDEDLADLEDTGFPRRYPVHDLGEHSTETEATDLPSRREMRAQERLVHNDDVIRDLAGDADRYAEPLSALEAPARGDGVLADSPAVRYAAAARIDDAPKSRRYDLDERHEDLLGESAPRSAFAHASSSTTTFIPESEPDLDFDEIAYGARQEARRQEARQREARQREARSAGLGPADPRRTGVAAGPVTSTVPVWILTLIPIYMLLVGLIVLLSGASASFAPITLAFVFGVPWVAGVAIALVDHRMLGRGGMVRPAHWAWAFLGAPVYLIARLVATVREAGNGFGPVLTSLGLGLVVVGAVIAVPGLVMELAPAQFAAEAERSIADDAASLGAELVVDCPDTPPLLVQQSFTCEATSADGDAFRVRVSLQRSNGWIDWRVDDWGIFTMGS